ncbi:TetR-like C-terminal domain-containing protein [Clostridium paridis]|uniref:WHG domain-containing protein n=1 Tax=Clostridium paridis TaxID=2803863 RepID=A0A937K416_9CLOT|nr:TetR-like C-terminal domain-containing protein [Clostridium paridis]MBL4930690.1 WHG domain-containing protein [Clostridium paridis]
MSPRVGLDINTILLATSKLADANGLEEVTLASLSKFLNIKTPSLYNHINGIQDLRKKLSIYSIRKLREDMANAAIGKSGDDAVHALADAYTSFSKKHPGLYSSINNVSDFNDEDLIAEENALIDVVLKVLAAYGLKGDSAIHATRGLRSILHGFTSLDQNNGFGLSQSVNESLHLTIDALIAGFYVIKDTASK